MYGWSVGCVMFLEPCLVLMSCVMVGFDVSEQSCDRVVILPYNPYLAVWYPVVVCLFVRYDKGAILK